jgi:putative PIN family toxin of toxin-antitoxin system
MRVVLDTNVLIAALISRGVCADLLEHCVLHYQLVSSEHILGELREHLAGKFKYSSEDADEAAGLLRMRLELVSPGVLAQPVCRDPDDDLILATATAGSARCIITGDKDLLVIQRFQAVEILRPTQFADFEARVSGEQSS